MSVQRRISAEEIASLLAAIPTPPDYDTRLRVSSAVFSALPMAEACGLLQKWAPEKSPGWYAEKHKYRLQKVGIGSLVFLAKQHGWQGRKPDAAWSGKVLVAPGPEAYAPASRARSTFAIPSLRVPAKSARPQKADSPNADSLRHADEQMAKITKAGWITGPSDPDAPAFAAAFEIFGATPELSAAP